MLVGKCTESDAEEIVYDRTAATEDIFMAPETRRLVAPPARQ